MYHYRTLENTNSKILHQAFVDAFSDYQVKMNLPLWKFQQMLQRRGYTSEISIGAFKDEELVGFIINGFRNWNGKPTVYDLGTGVVREYRKQGITSTIFQHIKELLEEKNVEQYLLEVIRSNTTAFKLYKQQGFEITRNFRCFQLDKNKYNPLKTCKVEHVGAINSTDWKQFLTFWDMQPSWQNSIDSVHAILDAFKYSIVRVNNILAGYGIIEPKSGDIVQIAVNKQYRRRGIARSILTDLLENTESPRVAVLNVDDQFETLKGFLLKSGFESYVDQYEMVLSI